MWDEKAAFIQKVLRQLDVVISSSSIKAAIRKVEREEQQTKLQLAADTPSTPDDSGD